MTAHPTPTNLLYQAHLYGQDGLDLLFVYPFMHLPSRIIRFTKRRLGGRPHLLRAILGVVVILAFALYQAVLPGNHLIALLVAIVIYVNLIAFHLTRSLGSTLKTERLRISRAVDNRVESEKARSLKALTAERARAEKHLGKVLKERDAEMRQRDSKWFQSFPRVLSEDDLDLLCGPWARRLNKPFKPSHLKYIQHRINRIEDLCLGRLAGTVQDAVLRTLVASSITHRELKLLEIGTLFGINAIAMYDALSRTFDRVHMTLLDPLDGYYGGGKTDVLTGIPVTLSILHRNLDTFKVPREDCTVIREYSTSSEAIKEAALSRYDLIFIDGDHSYEGVKADYQFYSAFLEPGGYLIFDDYRRKEWPGVERFVDEQLTRSSEFELVGSDWNTAILRKTAIDRPPDSDAMPTA